MNERAEAFFGYYRLAELLLPVQALPEGSEFVRIFARPDGDWTTAPAKYRNQRVDPPAGVKDSYSVLYLGDSQHTCEFEVRRLQSTHVDGREVVLEPLQVDRQHRIVRHRSAQVQLLVDLDSPLVAPALRAANGREDCEMWRRYSWLLLQHLRRYGAEAMLPITGVTYRSRQRGCSGRVFAIYDEFKQQALTRGEATVLA